MLFKALLHKRAASLIPSVSLDLSLAKTVKINKNSTLNITASITNAYNRENIFYFNRVKYERVNQLPLMPSLGMSLTF